MKPGNWVMLLAALQWVGCVVGPKDGSGLRENGDASTDADAASDDASCDQVSFDASDPRLPCDVEAVLVAKCQRCHNTDAVTAVCNADRSCIPGPFPLLTWQDTHQDFGGQPIYERMQHAISTGFMPLLTTQIMPPVEKLTDAEKALLLDWLGRCAPPADGVECAVSDGSAGAAP